MKRRKDVSTEVAAHGRFAPAASGSDRQMHIAKGATIACMVAAVNNYSYSRYFTTRCIVQKGQRNAARAGDKVSLACNGDVNPAITCTSCSMPVALAI